MLKDCMFTHGDVSNYVAVLYVLDGLFAGRGMVNMFIGKDEATGKSCLKIPLPEPEVINSIVSGLQQLLKSFS